MRNVGETSRDFNEDKKYTTKRYNNNNNSKFQPKFFLSKIQEYIEKKNFHSSIQLERLCWKFKCKRWCQPEMNYKYVYN